MTNKNNINEPQENMTLIKRVMSKYAFDQKIHLIFIVVAIVTLIISYLLISSLVKDINFAELELKGNRYQKEVTGIIENVGKHKILTQRYLLGDKNVREDISQLQSTISAQFTQLNENTVHFADQLKTSIQDFQARNEAHIFPIEIQANWDEIAESYYTLSVNESNQLHAKIVDNLQLILSHVADTTNLTFDPVISSHYLIQSTTRTLPESQDLLSKLLATGNQSLQSGVIEQDAKAKLLILSTLFRSNLEETNSMIQKSIIAESTPKLKQQMIDSLNTPLENYNKASQKFLDYINKINNGAEEQINLVEFSALGSQAFNKNFALWTAVSNELDEQLQNRISKIKIQGALLTGFVLISMSFALWLGYMVLAQTHRFFNNVLHSVKKFSDGDLSSRAPYSYDKGFEVMRFVLNELGDRIQEMVNQLHAAGVQLTTSTTQIAAAAKHQEGTVCQQEATVKQILVTAGEISSTAKEFAKTMNNISVGAEETSRIASTGKEDLNKMEETMRQMVQASSNIASKLAVLNEKASAITSVITTISKVADQTNLLSLNAAIEAEKAGEHGKSFSVIAQEIRRLADQTANATFDIERMVSEMMSAVSEGVMGVDKFTEEIRTGVSQVSTVSEQLTQIIEQVQQQTTSFEVVNKGMQNQSLGAEQINESIMQLSDAAQQTTNSIRQFHSAIDQLTIATKQMQGSVAKMKKSYSLG